MSELNNAPVVLDIRGLTKKFPLEDGRFLTACDNISLRVYRGQTLGIIGGTGAGKTSLVHMIPGFYRASEGTVRVNGADVRSYEQKELTDLIGIVMQKPVLFSGTIAENLRWGNPDATEAELLEAARLACCEDVISEHGGLDAQVLQGGRNFSGGQRQRLGIARALVKKPSILILDDASSALDYATDRKLRSNLKKLDDDMTVLMISQRTVSIQDCDRILVLDDGNMVGYGTHEELLRTCETYAEIYRSQGRTQPEGGVAS